MIVQKELVAIYDYEIPVPENPFSFRLEIHKCSELFTQVPSIDWSDSGYVQHFINVIEKILTR